MQKQECDLWIWKWTQASDIPVNLFEVILGRSVTQQLAHLRATVQEAEPNRKVNFILMQPQTAELLWLLRNYIS